MPHIHVRSTEDFDAAIISELLFKLTESLSEFDTIQSESVKAYWTRHEQYAMGENAPKGFVHCEVSILEGRPEELKSEISQKMYSVLKSCIKQDELGYTLELREMAKATYKK